MKSREEIFESWKTESLQDFWLISQEFFSSDSDFIELLDKLAYNVKRGKLKNSVDCDRYLFSLFLKTLGQKRRSVAEKIYLLALFRLNWPLEKLSSLTHEYSSKIKFLVTQSLKDKASAQLTSTPKMSADCCRTDLFLLDFLFDKKWNAPFKCSFQYSNLKEHLKKCERCSSLLKAAETIRAQNEYQESKALEYSYPYTRIHQRGRFLGKFDIYQNASLRLRSLFQVAVAVCLLGVIASVPFIGKFLIKKDFLISSTTQNTEADQEKPMTTWVDLALERDLISPPWLVSEQQEIPIKSDLMNFIENFDNMNLQAKQLREANKDKPTADEAEMSKGAATSQVATNIVQEVKTPSESRKEISQNKENLWIFYRWGAYADDLNAAVPKILRILESSMAEKAGELDLGAEYRGGRYFHFSIRTENLAKTINEIGTLKLEGFTKVEAKSDRQNKEGHSRIVFLLKQK